MKNMYGVGPLGLKILEYEKEKKDVDKRRGKLYDAIELGLELTQRVEILTYVRGLRRESRLCPRYTEPTGGTFSIDDNGGYWHNGIKVLEEKV